eukprot:TRINITY_DN6238_c0_g1_i2.p1 TRINITY_DN6238_c0_g1~~TRINITY_DN6238_c0_g1_i2.p1  ORF type:complete len:225 (+),score=41.60 TRINITY_DN6238_c0_g1_i2:120-794(+)
MSQTGERQLAFELTAQPEHFVQRPVKAVLCSPLRRALLTALAAYPEHRIVVDPRLRECDASSGLTAKRLRSWLKETQPDSLKRLDLSRVPSGIWWGKETTGAVQRRLSSVLKDSVKASSRKGIVALVTHSLAVKAMACCPMRPFPKAWGTPRGFPKNFKPYFARVREGESEGQLRIEAAHAKQAEVVLVRHAHSAKQAARTAEKKRRKLKASMVASSKKRQRRK